MVLLLLAAAFVRWDIGSLRSRLPLRVKTKALAPLAVALLPYGAASWAVGAARPALSRALALSPGSAAPAAATAAADSVMPVIASCLLHVLLLAPFAYFAADAVCRRVLRPGFDRPRGGSGDWTQTASRRWWLGG